MKNKILLLSFIAMFAALICVGCFLKIPLGIIPGVMQNALCILTAVLLGGIFGGAPTALFLVAGALGLPVYSGGNGGFAVWAGPTGGFLLGYFLGAVAASFIAGKPTVEEKKFNFKTAVRIFLAFFAGMFIIYVPGVIQFMMWTLKAGKIPVDKTAFTYAMTACVLPFIPGDLLKIFILVPVTIKIRPILAQYLYSNSGKSVDKNTEYNQNI